MIPKTVEWVPEGPDGLAPGRLRMIDQTRLPDETVFIETSSIEEVFTAIKTLQVRGAPAIGVAAAMGVAAAAGYSRAKNARALEREVADAAEYLSRSRPTAVNLFWALERMKRAAADNSGAAPGELKELLVREAISIRDEDAAMCRAIGEHACELLRDGASILTHCNAGSLAASELGTALAPVYVAAERGMSIRVYADETRPLLQGARLTAWELMQAGVDVTLICDNTAAEVMREKKVEAVFVGADRIAANGDTANKIGTYGLALLAKAHGIPMYVLAPSSTIDFDTPRGEDIPIEERAAREVTHPGGKCSAPPGVKVYSPAFDVTPAEMISAIVCEKGIARPEYTRSLRRITGRAGSTA
ncbi:MAG: S-methyl-5-thioribose-1-phosphate isomerase [Kiritimatiellia bacterium]